MSALQTDLTQGSVSGKLLRYAAPLVASSLLQAVYSITDIIIAGHFIGDAGMFSCNTLATGSGHTVFIMWNSFLNCIVVRLVLAIVLEHFMGICGVYLACGIAVSSSVPVGWWFCRSGRWKRPRLTA